MLDSNVQRKSYTDLTETSFCSCVSHSQAIMQFVRESVTEQLSFSADPHRSSGRVSDCCCPIRKGHEHYERCHMSLLSLCHHHQFLFPGWETGPY